MNFFKYIILSLCIVSCLAIQARDIHGYVSFGGNMGYKPQGNLYGFNKFVGFYDFKMGASYYINKNILITGLKVYRDIDILIETNNSTGNIANRYGLFFKWNYHLKNNWYLGPEISLLRPDVNYRPFEKAIPIYSISISKAILDGLLGFEIKCDYVAGKPQWQNHINNFINIYVKI